MKSYIPGLAVIVKGKHLFTGTSGVVCDVRPGEVNVDFNGMRIWLKLSQIKRLHPYIRNKKQIPGDLIS